MGNRKESSMLSMRHIRALGLFTAVTVGVLASVAGAAKGGGGVVAPPVVGGVAANLKATLTAVALPACTGAETNTTATPAVCQTAAPLLIAPATGLLPVPAATLAGVKARLHMPGLDPVKFPIASCLAQYTLGSLTATGPSLTGAKVRNVVLVVTRRRSLVNGASSDAESARV